MKMMKTVFNKRSSIPISIVVHDIQMSVDAAGP